MDTNPTGDHGAKRPGKKAANSLFLTPRVIDDVVAEELRGLVHTAGNLAARMEDLLRRGDEQHTRIAAEFDSLEVRLRLGATMIRAFQGLFEKAERSIAAIESKATALLNMESAVCEQRRIIDEISRTAIRELESKFAGMCGEVTASLRRSIEEPAVRMLELESRVAATSTRMGAMISVVDRIEQQLDPLTATADAIRRASRDVRELTGQCDLARQMLASDLVQSAERIDAIERDVDQLRTSMQTDLERAENAAERLGDRIDGSREASGALSAALVESERMRTEGATLLAQLAPWRSLLLEARFDQLPAPIAALMETLRGTIAGDCSRLASAMRGIADRADTIFALPLRDESDPPSGGGTIERDELSDIVARVDNGRRAA